MANIPSPVIPDYNTPAKSGFAAAKFFKERDGSYSAFWPLMVLFLALIVLFVYDTSYLRSRRLVLTSQLSQLVTQEKGWQSQKGLVEGVHNDMAALAPRHPQVAEILSQYFVQPSAGSTSGAESSPPQK